jgi:hypothetical protein
MKRLILTLLVLSLLFATVFFVSNFDFNNVQVNYEKIASKQDPLKAMEVLHLELEKNPSLENSCHGITHEIGHIAYEKYGFKKALAQFEDDICGSGYMHGVTESYIENSKNPLKDMLSACPKGYGACFHGIGHGLLLYYENDLPKATAGCDMFKSLIEQVQCSEGVFMQNFNTEKSIHDNIYLNEDDTLFPCNSQSDLHKSACYFYSPRYFVKLHPGQYKEAIDVCLLAPHDYIGRCIRGVGSVVMKQNIDKLQFVESICKSVPDEYMSDCYGGLVSYFTIHIGSIKEGQEFCSRLDNDFLKLCKSTVNASKTFFLD